MKIEVGKSYRTRSGDKVTIVDFAHYYPFAGSDGGTYTVDGHFRRDQESDYDLVSEWTDPVTFECEWQSSVYIHPVGTGIRLIIEPFLGKKTKVTVEVIE